MRLQILLFLCTAALAEFSSAPKSGQTEGSSNPSDPSNFWNPLNPLSPLSPLSPWNPSNQLGAFGNPALAENKAARDSTNDGNHDGRYFFDGKKVNDKYQLRGGTFTEYALRSSDVNVSALQVDKVKQLSGYLSNKAKDKHFFYWFFESRHKPKKDPIILWLNGGPGCSSLTGLFMELGPSLIDKHGHMSYNRYSWNNNASLLFLDQPVNTGFSYAGSMASGVNTTHCASKDVVAFLTLFFSQFPQYSKQAFHIAGESYAGKYIPSIAQAILEHKRRNINLQSVIISNGLTDVYTQYEYYEPMACGKGGHPPVLSSDTCKNMDTDTSECQSYINKCQDQGREMCKHATEFCNGALIEPYYKTGRSVYDIRKTCGRNDLCYAEISQISKYLNRHDVKEALGVEREFKTCNDKINRAFLSAGDNMQPAQKQVVSILKEIPALIYAGDADYICNWLGIDAWTKALPWQKQALFGKTDAVELETPCRTKYGSVRYHDNLAFLRVYNAGHMVPYDQPSAAYDFVNRWTHGEWQKERRT